MTCDPSDRILQTLRVHTPGAPDAVLSLELFNSMDKFFRRTNAWRFSSENTLIEGINEYGLGTPANSTVVRLLSVSHNDSPVAPVQATGQVQSNIGILTGELLPDGDVQVPFESSDINSSNVFSYAIYRPNYIQIVGAVDADKAQFPLVTVSALTLAVGCLECDCGDWAVDDWMWDAYFDDWVNGSLGRLYGMPAKPWFNAQLALVYEKRFRNNMAFRKQESVRGFNYGVPSWRFPRGGWT
jgi:hypothetical protein